MEKDAGGDKNIKDKIAASKKKIQGRLSKLELCW